MTWWTDEPFYELYVRSFCDSSGDGIGDIKGVTQRLDYLKWLGIKNVWVTPFFKSPMLDNGYDIENYCNVDPIFGDLQDFKDLVDKIRSLDMKLIIDVVPNHTSDRHPWFQASIKNQEPFKDYYIWHDGKIDLTTGQKVVPNNWSSRFGGPAWSWDPARDQFYMHTFHKEQPNLNCRNQNVIGELKNVLKFWMDLGVDGFRFDAVKHVMCDERFRDNTVDDLYFGFNAPMHIKSDKRYDWDQPGVYTVLRQLTEFIENYNEINGRCVISLSEAYTSSENIKKYYTLAKVNIPFNFSLTTWNAASATPVADKLRHMIEDSLNTFRDVDVRPNWVLGNHDRSRVGTRLGADKYPEMVDLANMLLILLPGTPFCYYGDELGMLDSPVSFDQCKDGVGKKLGPENYSKRSRDPCRAPMPWTDDVPNGGFTGEFVKPWLPLPTNYSNFCVEKQKMNPKSHLNFFRNLLTLKRSLRHSHDTINIEFVDVAVNEQNHDQRNDILAFFRRDNDNSKKTGDILVILNFDTNSKEQTGYLDLSKFVDNGLQHVGVCLTTPNVRHLCVDQQVQLDCVPICGLQGIVLKI